MIALKAAILGGHIGDPGGGGNGRTEWGQQRQGCVQGRSKKLRPNLARKDFRDQRWNSIPQHPLHFGSPRIDAKAVRESLDAAQLFKRQTTIVPMERTDGGAWLRLDSPRRMSLRELE